VEAGFDPELFWTITPRVYHRTMLAARERSQRDAEMQLLLAYQTASFSRAKKIEPFGYYLAKMRPTKRKSSAELIAALERSMQKR
jgi:hypothetical protein